MPSLREWLTRKQKETRRGRADLRLADRAALWNSKPENRHLPAWWEWANIRLLTRRADWTAPQKKMMSKAGKYHALRGTLLAAGLLLVGLGGVDVFGRLQAHSLRSRLLNAEVTQVPGIVADMAPYRHWINPLLSDALREAVALEDQPKQLRASLALLGQDPSRFDYLYERLLKAAPEELRVIRDALSGQENDLVERLRKAVVDSANAPEVRLRAACALAGCAGSADNEQDSCWQAASPLIAGQLLAAVQKNPSHYAPLMELLRPVGGRLLSPLAEIYRRKDASDAMRTWAISILLDYAADRPEFLADLLMDGDAVQFAKLLPRLEAQPAKAVAVLQAELDREPRPEAWPKSTTDPIWQKPADSVIHQLEAANGLCQEHFALCQTLPLAKFAALAEALRPCGYRPVRVRPYVVGTSSQLEPPGKPASEPLASTRRVLVAAVWQRDGHDWRLLQDVTAAAIEKQDADFKKQDFRPVDVAGWQQGAEARFAAVWVKEQPGHDVRLYVGVTEKGHAAAWQPFRTAKLEPATIQVFTGADSQARYSAVFRKTSLSGSLSWNDDEGTYGDRGLQDGLPVDASVLISPAPIVGEVGSWLTVSPWLGLARRSSNSVVPHPERLYAGVYAIDTGFDYVQIHGVTAEQQLARSQELAQQGYRPVALSAAASWPQAGVLTASVWHRPVISEDSKEKLAKRQANAGAALLRLREAGRAWPLLRHQPDPRARSYLLARLGSREVDPRLLVRQVDMERDAPIQRALLLGLGEFSEAQLPPAERDALMPRLIALYRDAPDKGVHGAAEWLLRHWQQRRKASGNRPVHEDWQSAGSTAMVRQQAGADAGPNSRSCGAVSDGFAAQRGGPRSRAGQPDRAATPAAHR